MSEPCDHPACELVIKGISVSRDVHEIWIDAYRCIRTPGKIHSKVDVRCAMCGQGIVLEGDL